MWHKRVALQEGDTITAFLRVKTRLFAYPPYLRYRRKKGLLRTQKRVFAFSLEKKSTRKTCNLRMQKDVFASQV